MPNTGLELSAGVTPVSLAPSARCGSSGDHAERRAWAGIDRQGVGAGPRRVVEQYVAVADLHERIALLRQLQADVRLRSLHPFRFDRVAGLQRQLAFDQAGRHGRLRGYGHAAQRILLAGDGADQRADAAVLLLLDGGERGRVIIAERLHQPHRQPLVLPSARGDDGGVGRLAVAVVQRGQRLEPVFEADLVEPLHDDIVADLRGVGSIDVGDLDRRGGNRKWRAGATAAPVRVRPGKPARSAPAGRSGRRLSAAARCRIPSPE